MTKKILAAALLASTAIGGAAYAGYKAPWGSVVISGGEASGALGRARNTPNDVEHIGCNVYGFDWSGGTAKAGFCWATDAGGKSAMCSTVNNSRIADAIEAINSTSFIRFRFDKNGYCTDIDVQNRSVHEPPQL